MRRFSTLSVTVAALTLAPAALRAADEAKPNTLTAKEIADGWLLLFDGETPFGWGIEGTGNSVPTAADGVLKFAGGDQTYVTTSEFCCFDLTFQYSASGKNLQLVLDGKKYDLPAVKNHDKWNQAQIRAEIKNDKRTVLAAFSPADKKLGKSDELAADQPPTRTSIGFLVPPGAQLQLRNVKLKPLNMQSLFDGKDLKGWKVIPGHPSKFSVTDKGELNIKNGEGEIQTEGQWADFILQLDVFSNGKCLNSGIFFRALPGEFWQGYEAQIRNDWDGYSNDAETAKKTEDRTKPHDFGTGGIYNRQPSRKVVSNDKEWFTYTVLADGNHIALWVNGYQTADYFDNAKDAPTARKGRYLGKGAITLQGHDPTTDLSFRNIRLQELPPRVVQEAPKK